MLGFNKAKKPDVLSHWYTLVDYFNIPSDDFYKSVQLDLNNRKVPGLRMESVIFSEGGFFSAKRIYLRMKRERLVFDICAAPFGTSYFFSMRFAELPPGVAWWRWIPLVVGLLWFWRAYEESLRWGTSLVAGGAFIVAVMLILCVLILFVEHQLRKESYYRQDTRLMYLEIVNTVVKQKIAEYTSAGGINLLDIRQHSPLMDDLYRTTQVHVQAAENPPEALPGPVAA